DAVGIELEVSRIELVAVEFHQVLGARQFFLDEREPDFLGTDRIDRMVELEHNFLPLCRLNVLRRRSYVIPAFEACGRFSLCSKKAAAHGSHCQLLTVDSTGFGSLAKILARMSTVSRSVSMSE